MNREFLPQLFVLIFSVVVIGGCTANSPKPAETGVMKNPSATTDRQSVTQPPVKLNQGSAGSSLDALRSGKSPASGPLKEIHFEFDSYVLSAEARSILQVNAAWLKANSSTQVEIEGHCDERGTTEYNLALGAKRARGAMDYLVSLGISPSRIKTVSYGEELPLCMEKSENCYQENRQDRFVEARARPGA